MRTPTLRYGDDGPAVQALQVALRHAMGDHARNTGKSAYGSRTREDVARFKRAHNIRPADGTVAGARVWHELLWRNLTKTVRDLLGQDIREALPDHVTRSEALVRARIVAEMEWMLAHAGQYTYGQVRPTVVNLRDPLGRGRLDCSSTVIACYHAAGAPNPSGGVYDGYGHTGTLWANGRRTTNPNPGDMAFYKWEGWRPGHVALHLADVSTVGSFGATPPSRRRPVNYRGDYIGSRIYDVTS